MTATAAAVASIASAWDYKQEVTSRDGTSYGKSFFSLTMNLIANDGGIELIHNMEYVGEEVGQESIIYMCFAGDKDFCIGSEYKKDQGQIYNFAQRSLVLARW